MKSGKFWGYFFSYILIRKHIPCHTVAAPWPALTHDQGQWGSSQAAKHVALTGWCDLNPTNMAGVV